MTTATEIITRALELLGTPEQWCQGKWGITAEGMPAEPQSPHAVSRCCQGALRRAIYELVPAIREPSQLSASSSREMWETQLAYGLTGVFAEQYPDLTVPIEELVLVDEARHIVTRETVVTRPRHVPDYNDHSLMTYEGVRSTMEKYLVRLQECDQ